MSTSSKKQIFWSIGLFVLFFFSITQFQALVVKVLGNIPVSQTATVLQSISLKNKKENIKLAFVGDIMLDRGVRNSVYKNFSGDYSSLFVKVKKQLEDYDLLVGNLEGPVSSGGEDVGGLYSFRMEPQIISILKDNGFDILSVANNHTFNWGQVAFVDTLNLISGANISYIGGGFSGPEAYQGKAVNIEGIKIDFLAFSEFSAGGISDDSTNPGLAIISEDSVVKNISQAKKNNDLVIVSFHFGEEYQELPNSYQEKYAKLAIDSGADLVVGHHPHYLQTLERYKNVYIIYSLGNFIFDQYFSKETMQGGLLEAEINTKQKRIEKVSLKNVFLNKLFQIETIN